MIKLFEKIFRAVTYFHESSILDVWVVSEYTSVKSVELQVFWSAAFYSK